MARLQERQKSRKEVRATTARMYQNEELTERMNFERLKMAESCFFAGVDPRRRKEVADSGMVQEDHMAVANLSPRAIHTQYPRFGYYSTPYIDDTVLE